MKTYSKKSAFSLIELSIVLIIIGLLVAGITGGASLIKSATLRAVMTEARSYNTAVNSFYVAYNAYPGDYNLDFGGTTASGIAAGFIGDNDGKIEFNSGGATAITKASAEGFGAIAMLSHNKMITNEIASGSYTTIAATTTGTAGTTLPKSKVKGAGWIFDYFAGDGVNPGDSVGWKSDFQNVVLLTTGFTAIGTTATLFKSSANAETPQGSMNAEDAKSVDLKLDDGLPNTGKVKGFGRSTATPTPVDCINGTGGYNEILAKNNECILTYAVDVTS